MFADFRFALRGLSRTPAFTLTAVLMLAAGIGVSMFMFSAMNTLAIQPLPFRNAQTLVHVDRIDAHANGDSTALSMREYLELRSQQRSLDSFSAYADATMNISGADGPPERLAGARISPDTFAALGVAPMLGRDFAETDAQAGAAPVALIGHRLWELNFNAAPDVIGRRLRVNGRSVEIVGVMPPKFAFPREQSLWMPLTMDRTMAESDAAPAVEAFGPLRAGVSVAQAQQELTMLLGSAALRRAAEEPAHLADVKPLDQIYVPARLLRSTSAMSIAVMLVLLISCANVASLMLARFSNRRRELSVRAALGASRRRLMRQVFSETTIIAILATLLGYAGARAGGYVMMQALDKVPGHLPYWVDFEVTFADVLFSVGIGGFVALVSGWLPARRVAGHDPRRGLGHGGPASIGANRGRGRFLVAFEVALCTALLASAALAIDSSIKAQQYPLGINSDGILTGRIGLTDDRYRDPDARVRFFGLLQARLHDLPGINAVALSSSLPLMSYERSVYERIGEEGETDDRRARAWNASVSEDYFAVFGIALREGRLFDTRDRRESAPVAVVSSQFAANAWPGKSALGQRLRLDPDDQASPWLEVIGVVADNLMGSPLWGGENNVFRPLAQDPAASVSFAVRAASPLPTLSEATRAAVAEIDRDLPVYWMRSMNDWRAQTFWPQTMLTRLFGIFAAFALVLAISGIYAVMAFDVAGRVAEIGVRRALGAEARGILSLILRRAGRQVLVGLIIGIPMAAGFSVLLAHNLMPGAAVDPLAYLSALIVLLGAVALATAIPARRALRVDPMEALRHE